MEILNLSFAIFVVQLAFCIVPIALGIRLFTLTSEKKHEISQKLSKKFLGEADLIKPIFYNFVLYLAGSICILVGALFTLYVVLVVLPQ